MIRYWKRRWIGSLVTISSGIGRPDAVVMTRLSPSTVRVDDAGEPLGEARRGADERPHLLGGDCDAHLSPNRSSWHRSSPWAGSIDIHHATK